MGDYILKRVAWTAAVIIGVTMLTFFLLFVLPGDPAEMLAISRYGAQDATREAIESIKIQEGLDKPILVQYGLWLGGVFTGDLGKSRISGKPVWDEIIARLPATLQLAGASLLLSLGIGMSLGIIAAVRRNTLWDYLFTGSSLIGAAIPNFWLGLMLILLFGIYFGLLPTFGYGTLSHLILPAFTVGVSMAGITARLTRSTVIEVLSREYIKTAVAKGLSRALILYRHVIKNASIPIITIAGIQFGYLLEGTVIVEMVFAWPGIGRLLIDAVHNRDFPQIQGCVLYIAFIICFVNLCLDISYTYLDPRVRLDKHD